MQHSTINDLGPQTLLEIFRLTGPHQCAQLATCQKLWRNVASDDSLWQQWAHEDFAMEEIKTPSGQKQDSWRSAYVAWHISIGKYGQYSRRAILAWRKIESWTAKHSPAVAESLKEPATEVELNHAERRLGFKIPDSLRVIYRLHNGQFGDWSGEGAFHGLFGGYSFYDHIVCTHFLPINEAVAVTIGLRCANRSIDYADGLKVALGGFGFREKSLMLLDKGSRLQVGCSEGLATSWDAVPPGGNDAMLRWLEYYADALHERFTCTRIREAMPPSICLFPAKPPWQRVCVTRGVRIRVAAIFISELSLQSSPPQPFPVHFFSYNVEFSLLRQDEQKKNWSQSDGPFMRPMSCVQLQTRHWIMKDENGQVTSEVRGEGVIGEYPVLVPGGTPFVYQSGTRRNKGSKSYMEGFFTFVEGTIQAPTGPQFDVQCPQFPLEKPDFVF